MSVTWQRIAGGSVNGGELRGGARLFGQAVQLLTLSALACGLFWVVWIYGNGLRDERYLDGWMLAAGFGAQFGFHIANKSGRLKPRWSARWRAFHIYLGYLLIAVFASHSDFSLPDTAFEWILWTAFALMSLSGILGTYLAASLKNNSRIDAGMTYERIPVRRAELAQQVHAIATDKGQELKLALPGLPHDDWIADLYAQKLQDFFRAPRNALSQLIGSEAALKRLMHDIDQLSGYVDKQNQVKLVAIKGLVLQKDRLDFTHVFLRLSKAWLFVHVPVTYALVVLSIFHVIVVYAFSSGAW